jgi:hypothetical protein
MLRHYIIDPVYEIWQFQVLPGVQGLWNSTYFWQLIVLLILALFVFRALRKKQAK